MLNAKVRNEEECIVLAGGGAEDTAAGQRGILDLDLTHDLDLDLFDYPDYELVIKALESVGMKLGMKVFYRKKIQQLVFMSQNNVPLDIVFWVKKNNQAVTYCEPGHILKTLIHYGMARLKQTVRIFLEAYDVQMWGDLIV